MQTYEELESQNYYITQVIASSTINKEVKRLVCIVKPLENVIFYRVRCMDDNGNGFSKPFKDFKEACEYYDSLMKGKR